MKLYAYYYPSWHHDPRRKASKWTEWELVLGAKPGFPGHRQPRLPLLGPLDLSCKENVAKQVRVAKAYGLDGFVTCFYWNRGKIALDQPIKHLFDVADEEGDFSIGLMWVNRWPHTNLPIDRQELGQDGLHPSFHDRIVTTDCADFEKMVEYCVRHFFGRTCYMRIDGKPFFAVFSTYELFRDLGNRLIFTIENMRKATLTNWGTEFFLCGIAHDVEEWLPMAIEWGFDTITSYVLLPDWKGPFLQEYNASASRATSLWTKIDKACNGIYSPSVTVGWDSSPRGLQPADGSCLEYPWSPVIIDSSPVAFRSHLKQAVQFSRHFDRPVVMITSWNEWSEGHALEPSQSEGFDYLEVVREVKHCAKLNEP